METAGSMITNLRRKQPGLEVDDLCACSSVRPCVAWACPSVASFAWCVRSSRIVVTGDDSRPSHIKALRNPRFVDGNGRLYNEASLVADRQWFGSLTLSMKNSAPGGRSRPTRMRPRVSSSPVRGSFFGERVRDGTLAVRAIVVGENRISAARLLEPLLHVRRCDGPRGSRLMARHAPASVRAQILEKGVVQIQRAVDIQCAHLAGRVLKVEYPGIGLSCGYGTPGRGKCARDHACGTVRVPDLRSVDSASLPPTAAPRGPSAIRLNVADDGFKQNAAGDR